MFKCIWKSCYPRSAQVLCTTANPQVPPSLYCIDRCSLNTAFQGRVLKRLAERSHQSCPQTHSKCRNSSTVIWEELWCLDTPSRTGNRKVFNCFCLSDSSSYSGYFLKITVERHWNHFSSNSGFFLFRGKSCCPVKCQGWKLLTHICDRKSTEF